MCNRFIATSESTRFHCNGLKILPELNIFLSSVFVCTFICNISHHGCSVLLSIMYAVSFLVTFLVLWTHPDIFHTFSCDVSPSRPLSAPCLSCVDICQNAYCQTLLWAKHIYRKMNATESTYQTCHGDYSHILFKHQRQFTVSRDVALVMSSYLPLL